MENIVLKEFTGLTTNHTLSRIHFRRKRHHGTKLTQLRHAFFHYHCDVSRLIVWFIFGRETCVATLLCLDCSVASSSEGLVHTCDWEVSCDLEPNSYLLQLCFPKSGQQHGSFEPPVLPVHE